ncbi:YaaA family protein [Candidatus Saccharibacteria bacterium]|nr:YaaA family protein [Candidatus Saccharibacteria bacterium]
MIILIHTSKTMRPAQDDTEEIFSKPLLLSAARELAGHLKTISKQDIEKTMKVSAKLAGTTKALIDSWNDESKQQRAAIDSFLGDIYSGLQVGGLTPKDRIYADEHVRILSGLYGILRPLDGIYPYRFEMGYKLSDPLYRNMYSYWGSTIAETLDTSETIIDLSAVEYGKTVTKFVETSKVVTPRFLTVSPKTGEPSFVVVHAKVARGAFAGWMIRNQIEDAFRLRDFSEIGYSYDEKLSTADVPVFVCKTFRGIGLSVRLT